MSKTVKIGVFLPADLHKAVKLAAIESGTSMSQLVANMLLKKYGKEAR